MIELSKEQLAVVNSQSKNIIVDAAAGSGKTRVLTERVKKLLESGKDAKSFVIITFTNEAANELKERLKDVKNSKDCFIGTIHSYANRLLKKTGKDFDIFSEFYQTQFMEILIPKYALYCTIDDYYSFLKYDKMVSSGRMSASEISSKFSDIKVYNEIMQLLGRSHNYSYEVTVKDLCADNNIITFDELLELATKYFKETGENPQYLFVDELQDIGYLEYDFLMALKSKHTFVVGDTFQALYAWKGGDVNIFLSLVNNPDWKYYKLVENYRTAVDILRFANAIIKNAKDIIPKEVVPKREEKGELKFIAKNQLDSFLSKIDKDEKWYILTRSNKELNMIDTALKKQNIDHCCKRSGDVSMKLDKNICIMTIHTSKGSECDNVALYGKLPVNGKGESDEIKVLYVGLTRAKNKCIVFI